MSDTRQNNGMIYSVSHLTREIKTLLEDRFPFVWIAGEISNYALPASGHSYFSLKDNNAVINCVMFKGQKRRLKFAPENGMKVMGMARLSLYEPRGNYQLIFEHLEPEGAGSLQIAFEQLKKKLANEGLFDASNKKPLPFLPHKISVVTSGTGAAVQDIIHIAHRRFPNCHLEIFPVKVQGNNAEVEIATAIEALNTKADSPLIILARGGGSLEDLAAFNSEQVARAMAASEIPIITGVGHETDFTIADFVADARAATPSGAAEMALPEKAEVTRRVQTAVGSMEKSLKTRLDFLNQKLDDLHFRLKSPEQVIGEHRKRLGEMANRMEKSLEIKQIMGKERLQHLAQRLSNKRPAPDISHIQSWANRMERAMEHNLNAVKNRTRAALGTLEALSPSSVLDRGYGIVRALPSKKIVLDAQRVELNAPLEIILAKGRLETRVEKIDDAQKKNI